MSMTYKYPLQSEPFGYWDRLKVSAFLLNKKNRLTMGEKVAEFEQRMTEKYDCHALAVSSGSAANHLIFELWKQRNPQKFKNALVIAPAVTWISSLSPAIMSGYQIKFCDVNLKDFSFDYEQLENILKQNKSKNCIIWPTALIGFCPDFSTLRHLATTYRAELWGDFCENQFSTYNNQSIFKQVTISSLSCYIAHEMSCIEGGFVFLNNGKDFEYAKTLRNHGLTRSLDQDSKWRQDLEYKNYKVDKQFLFATMGTNWRMTDLNAYFGLLDFKRLDKYKVHRSEIGCLFKDKINSSYYLPPCVWDIIQTVEHVPFCLPIFRKDDRIWDVKFRLRCAGWETRPIIGGCLPGLQPAFKHYKNDKFPNAKWIHEHGCYVGLSNNLKNKDINKLTDLLNKI